nr:hypothetical protein [Pelomonas sp. Root1217]
MLAAPFLHDDQAHRDNGEESQEQALAQITQQQVDGRRRQQQQEHRLGEHPAQRACQAALFRIAHLVGANEGQALARLGIAQPSRRRGRGLRRLWQ